MVSHPAPAPHTLTRPAAAFFLSPSSTLLPWPVILTLQKFISGIFSSTKPAWTHPPALTSLLFPHTHRWKLRYFLTENRLQDIWNPESAATGVSRQGRHSPSRRRGPYRITPLPGEGGGRATPAPSGWALSGRGQGGRAAPVGGASPPGFVSDGTGPRPPGREGGARSQRASRAGAGLGARGAERSQ